MELGHTQKTPRVHTCQKPEPSTLPQGGPIFIVFKFMIRKLVWWQTCVVANLCSGIMLQTPFTTQQDWASLKTCQCTQNPFAGVFSTDRLKVRRRFGCRCCEEENLLSSSEVLAGACPFSSEVPAVAVRRSACHPSFEELVDVVRRKVEGANPSSSEVLAAVADKAAGLGRWRACLPTPNGSARKHTTNTQQAASSSRYMPRCSATIQMHQNIPNCALRKIQLTCTSNADHQGAVVQPTNGT